MHRSGTSLVAELLARCGVFLGRHLDRHHEAICCRRLNDALLARAGATWFAPEPYRTLRDDPEFTLAEDAFLSAALSRGFEREFSQRRLRGLAGPAAWGWKDPRTCLTRGAWLRALPGARLVHVVRHPLAVALSLRQRQARRAAEGHPVPAVADLAYNLGLWDAYVADASAPAPGGAAPYLLRYERLTGAPTPELERLLHALSLSCSSRTVRAATALVRPAADGVLADESGAVWRELAPSLPMARELGYE